MSEKEIHDLQKQIAELSEAISALDKKISPTIEAYNAAIKLGAWAKYGLWIAGSGVGLFLALKEIFKK